MDTYLNDYSTDRFVDYCILDAARVSKKKGVTLLEFLGKAAQYYLHPSETSTHLQRLWRWQDDTNGHDGLLPSAGSRQNSPSVPSGSRETIAARAREPA